MLALQNSILEQSDIVPVLQDFDFQLDRNELLIVSNPPKGKTLEEFSNAGKTEELDA